MSLFFSNLLLHKTTVSCNHRQLFRLSSCAGNIAEKSQLLLQPSARVALATSSASAPKDTTTANSVRTSSIWRIPKGIPLSMGHCELSLNGPDRIRIHVGPNEAAFVQNNSWSIMIQYSADHAVIQTNAFIVKLQYCYRRLIGAIFWYYFWFFSNETDTICMEFLQFFPHHHCHRVNYYQLESFLSDPVLDRPGCLILRFVLPVKIAIKLASFLWKDIFLNSERVFR